MAAVVFVGGWALAVVAYIAVGNETCSTTVIPIAGPVQTCTDTTAVSVMLVLIVGFASTLGSVMLLGLRFIVGTLDAIEKNARRGRG